MNSRKYEKCKDCDLMQSSQAETESIPVLVSTACTVARVARMLIQCIFSIYPGRCCDNKQLKLTEK